MVALTHLTSATWIVCKFCYNYDKFGHNYNRFDHNYNKSIYLILNTMSTVPWAMFEIWPPIDRTPGIPGSDENIHIFLKTKQSEKQMNGERDIRQNLCGSGPHILGSGGWFSFNPNCFLSFSKKKVKLMTKTEMKSESLCEMILL